MYFGFVEVTFAIALSVLPKQRVVLGWLVAARFVGLLFQPVLVVSALWCTAEWKELHQHRNTAGVPSGTMIVLVGAAVFAIVRAITGGRGLRRSVGLDSHAETAVVTPVVTR